MSYTPTTPHFKPKRLLARLRRGELWTRRALAPKHSLSKFFTAEHAPWTTGSFPSKTPRSSTGQRRKTRRAAQLALSRGRASVRDGGRRRGHAAHRIGPLYHSVEAVTGVIPPLSAAEWAAAFEEYKKIPQFTELFPDMDLEVQGHLRLGMAHRLLGRLVGAVFAAGSPGSG